jgi:hypothetical protein
MPTARLLMQGKQKCWSWWWLASGQKKQIENAIKVAHLLWGTIKFHIMGSLTLANRANRPYFKMSGQNFSYKILTYNNNNNNFLLVPLSRSFKLLTQAICGCYRDIARKRQCPCRHHLHRHIRCQLQVAYQIN